MKRKLFTWRNYHKWVGIVFCVFLLVFCLSGIVLNHRTLFSACDVNRSLLPPGYRIAQFNNGIVKGTERLPDGRIVAYGCGGTWLTDSTAAQWTDFNAGFPSGVDRRNVRNLVRTKDNVLWCATNFALFRHDGKQWVAVDLPKGDERLMDLTLAQDSVTLVALSRSAVYIVPRASDGIPIYNKVQRRELKAAKDFAPKETLFRTVWKLHSGELFGLTGRLIVDAIAVVLIVLCLTGIVLFVLPYSIRRNRRKDNKEACRRGSRRMVWHLTWHNRFGRWTIVLTLFLTITGTCLRPPLMIPFVLCKTAPANFTHSVWHDRLRAIRWDSTEKAWLVHTADGFLYVDATFSKAPTMLRASKAAPVSPMGANVFCQEPDGTWLIGSFSGLYRWKPSTGELTDWFTGGTPELGFGGAVSQHLVSGMSTHFGRPVVFDYATGANGGEAWKAQPEVLAQVPLSLWNFALELHVGRCYAPLLGPLSELFVFLWGTLSTLVLLSGYIINRRTRKKKSLHSSTNKPN